jgi:predicted TPR repeat methyltransferase
LEHEAQAKWISDALAYAETSDKILEIGSAFGRDAEFMQALGYSPTLTDAFDAAVEYLHSNGHEATKLNVLTDKLEDEYKVIIACAVFLHFTEDEFRDVLMKLSDHIERDGVLAFSVKNGEGEEWSDEKMGAPRYFHYWNPQKIQPLLEESGYEVLNLRLEENDKWLYVIAKPKEESDI